MDRITETVQASELDGRTVRAVIRDGRMRVITYHGRAEAVLVKLPNGDIEETLLELRRLLTAGAVLNEE